MEVGTTAGFRTCGIKWGIAITSKRWSAGGDATTFISGQIHIVDIKDNQNVSYAASLKLIA